VTVPGIDEPLPATVARVAPAVDPATLLGSVRVAITGTHQLTVGTAANGQIVIAKRPGIKVPADAVRRSMVGADEIVVCDKDVARVRPVTIGQRGEKELEILKGVVAGEKIVTDHVLGLEDGQALTAPAKK
jgi:multidrug efflux pump subunit AcrA (membrane-fusion protein)